ncbi:Radical SAM domain protein [uncultured Alphaproteobacteria bacterium]|uniref:Radical SAM domain protein n=1 Tax=uncultured Alphaproteobacteria bacterium TaxID=91750 RepID=A0A212ITS8_9PROT|nr:Radical SAM domain protein [uncultured Alphaproteobacteria bacterium]
MKLLVVWATTRCQLRCRYCYMSAGACAAADLDPAEFDRAAETLGLSPFGEVQIAGGEPLLACDVVEAVARRARALGVRRIGVQTNGLRIDGRFVAMAKDLGLAVGVSLDGPPAINDRVRGRTAEVLAGLGRLEAAGIPFGVTAVVCRETVATLPDLVLILAGFRHARSLGLDILRPAGRATEADLPSPDSLGVAFAALVERLDWINRRRARPVRLRELGFSECGAQAAYCPTEAGEGAVLAPGGAIYPCASLVGRPEFACGTAADPDLAKLRRGLRPDRSGCAACVLSRCRGRCPSRTMLSPRAAALDCVLREAASRIVRHASIT